MRHAVTIFKILSLIGFLAGSLVLGSLYGDTVRHTPLPAPTISGSLG